MTPANMNTSNIILRRQALRYYFNLCIGRALPIVSTVIVIAFLAFACSAAFGANPAEEMAKAGATGGIDPKGNSWFSIQKSIEQFAHPSFILDRKSVV